MFLFALERARSGRTDSEHPERALFSRNANQNKRVELFRIHPSLNGRVHGVAIGAKWRLPAEHTLNPRLCGGDSRGLLPKSVAQSHRSADRDRGGMSGIVKQKYKPVTRGQAFDQMAQYAL